MLHAPPVASISLNGIQASLVFYNLNPAEIYQIQGKTNLTNLTDAVWTELGTTSGLSILTWTLPATNQDQFFRLIAE